MNIAVVTVCAPTKGIALPLVSAGGSGVLFLSTGIGLLVAVAAAGEYAERTARGASSFIRKPSTWGPAS
jgi:cell division protein FtsW (lipid II flippase)